MVKKAPLMPGKMIGQQKTLKTSFFQICRSWGSYGRPWLRHIWSSASLKASPFCWWVTSSLELFVPPLVSGLTRAKGLIWRIEVVHGGLNACWLPFFGVLKVCATPTLLKSPLRRIQTAGKCLFVDLSSSMPRIWILRHWDSDTFWLNHESHRIKFLGTSFSWQILFFGLAQQHGCRENRRHPDDRQLAPDPKDRGEAHSL